MPEQKRERLWWYAAIWYPSHEERKNGVQAKVVCEPSTLLARDDKAAMMKAARAIPEEYADA